MRGIIVAKFIPGLSTLAPPLAGSSGVKASRFFFFDGLGSSLYAAVFICIGVLFSNQLEQIISALESLGSGAFAVVVGLLALYVGYKLLLSLFTDFENFSVFKPDPRHEKSADGVFDQVVAWRSALRSLREKRG